MAASIVTTTPIGSGSLQAELNDGPRCTWTTIQRPNGEKVEFSFSRAEAMGGLPCFEETRFGVFVEQDDEELNPNGDDFVEHATLSLPELVLLRDFLNRPEVQKLLDEEAAALARKAEKVAVAS